MRIAAEVMLALWAVSATFVAWWQTQDIRAIRERLKP